MQVACQSRDPACPEAGQVPSPAPRRKDPLPLRFSLSRQTAQDGGLSPFSAATRCAGLAAEEKTGSNMDCSPAPKKEPSVRTVLFFGLRGLADMWANMFFDNTSKRRSFACVFE